ncbi:hypothetical protein Zmor_023050 [Zophobas morio]|uniref:CRAL-TRIO domain-containing protein n=1 Tax=Zophobas morio TaxID=2755281 RepID=A0AA38HZX7_9CUCU|nr:hypothetical protein Zmor_023050 [Zophobas morio]
MMRLKYFEFSDNDEQKIFNHFHRTTKMVAEDVQTIQEWMKVQPHLPEVLDTNSIKNFLIISKCSVEIAKQKIEMRYLMRQKIPDIFENINPRLPHMNTIFDALYWVPLPKLVDGVGRVFISKVRNPDLCRHMEHHTYNGHHFNFVEIYLKESLQLNFSVVFDLSHISNENFKHFVPSILRKMVMLYHNAYSWSMKGTYFVNSHPNLQIVLSVLKTLIKPKLMQRIHFCKSERELVEIFPKEILPVDYGGEERSLEELNEMIKEKFLEYQHHFDEIASFVIDEKLVPKKLINDDFLGFYGNFKKLEID